MRPLLQLAHGAGFQPVPSSLLHTGSICLFALLLATGCGNLHQASNSGDLSRIQSLVAAGADVNAAVEDQGTPLHQAALQNQTNVASWLVRNGANLEVRVEGKTAETPLYSAVVSGHLEMVQLLLGAGANANARENREGHIPLHAAAAADADRARLLAIARLLLDHGADPNATNRFLETPLHIAAIKGRVPLVELLLSRGADPQRQRYDGVTPLHSAAATDGLEAARLLLAKGADVNSQQGAADSINPDSRMLKVIREKGINPSDWFGEGNTPLSLAVERAMRDSFDPATTPLMQLFLEAGARPTVTGSRYLAAPMITGGTFRACARYQEQRGNSRLAIEYFERAAEFYDKAPETLAGEIETGGVNPNYFNQAWASFALSSITGGPYRAPVYETPVRKIVAPVKTESRRLAQECRESARRLRVASAR